MAEPWPRGRTFSLVDGTVFTRPRYNPRTAGALLLIAGTVNILLNMISEGVYPGYNLGTNALSDMGAIGAPTFLLWNGQLLITGVLSFVGVLLFLRSRALPIPSVRLAWILYLVPPMGTIIVSLFPENSILALHIIGAFMVFIFGGLGAIYAYRFTKSPFRHLSIALGAISLVAILLFGAPPLVGFGVAERLVVYPFNIWVVSFAGYLMSSG
jgi:hypothetical membrane protein